MKKSVVLMLVCSMIWIVGVPWGYAEGMMTRKEAVEQIIDGLYEGMDIDSYYCIHENGYTHFVPADSEETYPKLCDMYSSADGPNFSDIEQENAITLAKAMGIISGNGDGTFSPDDMITYAQAVKMLVCAAEVLMPNQEVRAYPEDYLKRAQELEITEGFSYHAEDIIKADDFLAMQARAMHYYRRTVA
jgi:hypothetical protein